MKKQFTLTGYAGLFVALVYAAVAAWPCIRTIEFVQLWWPYRKLVVIGLMFIAMASVELFGARCYREHFDFSSPKRLDGAALRRIIQRVAGTLCCFAIALPGAIVLSPWFSASLPLFALAVPLTLAVLVPYFWLVEMYGKNRDTDELLLFGRNPFAGCNTLVSASLLKGLFVPLMLFSAFNFWQHFEIEATAAASTPAFVLYQVSAALFYLCLSIDVSIAFIGYATSCKLLNSEILSVDRNIAGWFWALVCYPPIGVLLETFLLSRIFHVCPQSFFVEHPFVGAVLNLGVIALTGIYCWATVCFGLRFSNLTFRGLVASGPYRYLRHPAYAAKNLAWWIGSIYLVFGPLDNVLITWAALVAVNMVYFLRALSEERHLGTEPIYRDYCSSVRYRFVPGLF